MIFCVVNQTVIGKYDPLGTAAAFAQGINVTFGIFPIFRQKSFVIAEIIAADAHAGGNRFQTALFPAQITGLLLGHKIQRKFAVKVDIQSDIFLTGITSVRIQIRLGFFRWRFCGSDCLPDFRFQGNRCSFRRCVADGHGTCVQKQNQQHRNL